MKKSEQGVDGQSLPALLFTFFVDITGFWEYWMREKLVGMPSLGRSARKWMML